VSCEHRVRPHNHPAKREAHEVSTDYYKKTLTSWFNAAAFVQPDTGMLGNVMRDAVVGPAYWNVDLAVSRIIALGPVQHVELRTGVVQPAESFQLGRSADELQCGDVRPYHDSGRRTAHHVVRNQI